MRRVQAFSHLSTIAASLIAVFTVFTVLDELFARSDPDSSMAITVALCGLVTAILCLDAARVATTQDLEQRLLAAEALQQDRKKRLGPLKRDVPSGRYVWLSSGALFVILGVVPGALLEYQDRTESTLPVALEEFGSRLGLIASMAAFLALFLVLNFGVLLILTVLPNVRRGWKVFLLLLLGVPSCLLPVAGVLDVDGADPFTRYTGGLFPALAFLSMLAAFLQATRGASSWITKFNFGFHGLLRFWAMVVLLQRFRGSNDYVSWLKHALHEPVIALDSSGTSDQLNRRSADTRLSGFFAALIRR
jgi:hypothetical protein